MKLRRISFAAVLTAALTLTAPTMAPSQAAQPSVPAPSPGAMPNAVPGTNTPAVDNGDVRAIARVGSAMIMGGNFTSVGGQVRNHVAAFNAATGALSTTFHPSVDGAVFAVISGPVANTAFIGGQFSSVGGVAVNDLALIDTTDGHLVSTFQAPSLLSGQVNDLVLRGNRLYLGGTFPKVGGVNHAGLASLNATSGALDPFVNIQLAGHHNDTGGGAQGAVGPWALDVTADGSKMVVIGNFKTANGLLRDQVVMIDLSGASAAVQTSWATSRYSPLCFNWAFDSYVRGVSFSPDGSYFVIAATGGPNAGTLCDAVARFETSATGTDVQPTWIDETGGDTVWAITVTDTAVFVGGHQRWANNPDGGDSAGPGAVPRPGLMALDPISGRPLQWNPGRNPPGKAVYALLATSDGLYVGSNTDWIGNRKYKRQKIAFFPYAGGIPAVSTAAGQLPGSVYLGGSQATNVLYRVNAGGPTLQSLDAGPNWISDSDADSPYRNSGSNAGVWDPVPSVDSSVPSSTAAAVFDTERWDPGDGEEMTWQFPVASGTPLDVRLYLANRCGCTGSVGARVFDVELNGQPWINDEDLVADVGDQVGTMKHLELNAPASGVITITFLHQTENTLVNGIEIVRTDITPPTTNVLYRVNAGGPAIQSLDGGANWRGDEAGDSPLRNSGSNTAGWSPVSSVDATVPSSTPAAIFDTERWDPGDGDEMSWQFPVTAGTPVEVRLYLANRCDCTNSPGARVFDVDLNGQPWINDEDLVADVGDQVGTMKSLDLNAPASGVITITFRHQTENPLVNGIEIVRTDISPDQGSGVNGLSRVGFDGTTASTPQGVANGGVPWSKVRGAFMVGDTVFYGYTDGFLYSRSFTGTTFGPAKKIDPYHDPVWANVDNNLGGTFNGASPSLYSQMPNVTGMVYADGKLYYTLFGDSNLGWRWFSPDSGIVDERSNVVSSSVDFTDADGMFIDRGSLYYATKSDGNLQKVAFSDDTVSGGSQVVSGPIQDGVNWSNRALFLHGGEHVNVAPTARFGSGCTFLSCNFDGSASSDPDGQINSYTWDFGDGQTGIGATPSHAYAGPGQYNVQLTVTDDDSAIHSVPHQVTVAEAPNQPPTARFTSSCTDMGCAFNGTTSSDPDGQIDSYAWDFGDGETGSGVTPSHTYANAGTYTVVLTVTDNDTDTGSASHPVTVPVVNNLSFVGASHSIAGSKKVKSAVVPSGVHAGDTMVLVFTRAPAATWTGPAGVTGWVLRDTFTNGAMISTVWTKPATAGDLGGTVRMNSGAFALGALTLAAYSGADTTTAPAVVHRGDTSTATHVTPQAVAAGGEWVVSFWADKSTATSAWTAPAGVTVRDTVIDTGTSRFDSQLADSGAPVGPGQQGGLTATTNAVSQRGVMFTIMLKPAA